MASTPALDVKIASRLAPLVQLLDVGFVSINGKLVNEDPSALPAPDAGTLTFDVPKTRSAWTLDGRALRVILPLTLFIEVEDNATKKKVRLAELGVVMRLDYELKSDTGWTDDELPHFVGISGYMHAWPYFRAEIQWLTSKLNFPPLTLPVLLSGQAGNQVEPFRVAGAKIPAPPISQAPPRTTTSARPRLEAPPRRSAKKRPR
jgi:hypothetical protein